MADGRQRTSGTALARPHQADQDGRPRHHRSVTEHPGVDPEKTPLLLGVAEAERPGRLDGLDKRLLQDIEAELGLRFHPDSNIIARGRVSAAVALLNARTLIYQGGHRHVLVAGVDSFLCGPTLAAFEERERLLTSENSNGFIPGEGAAAVVLAAPVASATPQLACIGLGFGMEKATVEAEGIPLRAEGLTQAVRAALSEAGCGLEQMDYRLTDISGEQYYFRKPPWPSAGLYGCARSSSISGTRPTASAKSAPPSARPCSLLRWPPVARATAKVRISSATSATTPANAPSHCSVTRL